MSGENLEKPSKEDVLFANTFVAKELAVAVIVNRYTTAVLGYDITP